MTKQEICRSLERVSGTAAFITATQLTQALGMKTVWRVQKNYLEGLDRVDGKYYFIPDVAKVLMERR